MSYTPYCQLLRDPRWQKKRLEIMERDRWRCRRCGSAGKTLNVHHGYYEKGNNPWDYPDGSLFTLCEKCHETVEQWRLHVLRLLGLVDPICEYDFGKIAGHIRGLLMRDQGWPFLEVHPESSMENGELIGAMQFLNNQDEIRLQQLRAFAAKVPNEDGGRMFTLRDLHEAAHDSSEAYEAHIAAVRAENERMETEGMRLLEEDASQ